MIRLIVTAPRGQMGSLVVQEAFRHPDIEVIGCVGRPDSDIIGMDAGQVCGLGRNIGAPVYGSLEAEAGSGSDLVRGSGSDLVRGSGPDLVRGFASGTSLIDLCDVVVDYSRTGFSMEVLDACVRHGKALLCGTTGFDEAQLAAFAEAAEVIPLMQTANTSYVVTVMKKLLREAAAMLEGKAGIEIVEAHSDTKLDAPSGTAIELAEEMVSGMENATMDDVTYHSLRAGNTPSSHHVVFGCHGEMLRISHDAYDWRCYATGACDGVLYLAQRAAEGRPGSYSMFDVVG